MCIACGGGRLCVPEQFADDWEPEAQARADARMCVAKIVYAQPGQTSPLNNCSPGPVEVGPGFVLIAASGLAGNDVCADPREVGENIEGGGIQHNRFLARL